MMADLPYAAVSSSPGRGKANAWRVPLWNAIDDLVRLHGGDPGTHRSSRISLVNRIEGAVETAMSLAIAVDATQPRPWRWRSRITAWSSSTV